MKPRRDITPYMSSSDINVNASLTLLKMFKRLRMIDPTYKPVSRYQSRLMHAQAARKTKLHITR